MIAKAQSTPPPAIPSVLLDEETPKPWHLSLSLSQLIAAWLGIAAMMFLVFLFGLYAGRRQGVEIALEEQSTPRLRLPVSDTLKLDNPPKTFEAPVTKAEGFDFGAASTVAAIPEKAADTKPPAAESTSGFVAKATEEILVPKTPPAVPAKSVSLLDSVAKVEISPALEASKPETIRVEPAKSELSKVEPSKLEKSIVKAETVTETPVPPKVVSKVTKPEKKLEKKPETRPESRPESRIAETPKSGGLYVQVAAPDSAAQAQNLINKLRAKGISSAVRDAKVGGRLHYRVLLGPFSSRAAAENAKAQVQRSGAVSGEPFIKNY